jgi:hypothetical protein
MLGTRRPHGPSSSLMGRSDFWPTDDERQSRRIEINVNLSFLLVPGRGFELGRFPEDIQGVRRVPIVFTRQVTRCRMPA